MNLRDLRYLLAVAQHRHFGRAAAACNVSQPTLSSQVAKLEARLGAPLFERTNKWVAPTPLGEEVLVHAARAVAEADAIVALAGARDPLAGPLTLGVIPTLGPYLMPRVFAPLRRRCPALTLELWEDTTDAVVERLRRRQLDAALIATPVVGGDLVEQPLFQEKFLAALPPDHALADSGEAVDEAALAADLLVLADGHCLRDQALAACARPDPGGWSLRATSLETLLNMVAAGYGTTLVPALAAAVHAGRRDVAFRPLAGAGTGRLIRLVSRPTFARQPALDALAGLIRTVAPAKPADTPLTG
ncbi:MULTISPECIES: hydrogen peroxide-inducible genes activator [Nitrospirillum]|uniref:LysR family hydrogen peroxide-inducible transcriptional activator n=2 Tax=Nitrospirillum TaxID=1543705 RepID=A0A560G1N7_9PROT|nr:hydrogen peroxide-inducible genes activator [Nitrospirillum amazonense]MEC4589378.1 hydrogen peroxide-inducible genes activator [Nitrospirillum amazonense]TWB27815.1 LysR family hydrogen peroxide-inducible transcriptional activator [Nitrospirillum amazonense]